MSTTLLSDAERGALRELAALGEPLTHEEIAERLSVTRETVKKHKAKALEKMRKHVRWTPREKE